MKNIRVSGYQGKKEKNLFDKEESKSNYSIKEKFGAGFEKLWVWQRAYVLMEEIHKFCKNLPREEKFRLRDQIERSSSSVCDNIAEGYTAYYYKDKIKGVLTARKESGETQNHIYKLISKELIKKQIAKDWIDGYEQVIRGINGFVNYIRRKAGRKR